MERVLGLQNFELKNTFFFQAKLTLCIIFLVQKICPWRYLFWQTTLAMQNRPGSTESPGWWRSAQPEYSKARYSSTQPPASREYWKGGGAESCGTQRSRLWMLGVLLPRPECVISLLSSNAHLLTKCLLIHSPS